MPKWTPNSSQRQIIETLALEAAKESSATEFVRNFCDFGPSKWSKIVNALDPSAPKSYFDEIKDPESEMANLAILLEAIPLKRALAERMNSQAVFTLIPFRAIAVAINECMAKIGPERLVKYLAPTGGAKSMCCAWLNQKPGINARVVEVRAAWGRSYFTVLQDIAKAVGARIGTETRPSAIEDELVKLLSSQKMVLALDEAEFFGAAAINGIKLLLNKTRITIMLAAIPEAHDKWNRRFPMEADQLTRRTHAIVELSVIDPADASQFFPAGTFKDRPGALKFLCEDASRFGHFSLIKRVAKKLQGVEKNGIDDVKAALAAATREMRRLPAQPSTK
jgi:hypothetical protein